MKTLNVPSASVKAEIHPSLSVGDIKVVTGKIIDTRPKIR
jgi:hypothetical protein